MDALAQTQPKPPGELPETSGSPVNDRWAAELPAEKRRRQVPVALGNHTMLFFHRNVVLVSEPGWPPQFLENWRSTTLADNAPAFRDSGLTAAPAKHEPGFYLDPKLGFAMPPDHARGEEPRKVCA